LIPGTTWLPVPMAYRCVTKFLNFLFPFLDRFERNLNTKTLLIISSQSNGDDMDENPGNYQREGFTLKVSADRKRQDRNSREQQRSYKISQQIENLKDLLDSSGIKVRLIHIVCVCCFPDDRFQLRKKLTTIPIV
jgi:hypothetical protein